MSMTGLRCCIDSSGTYFVNVISQNGRNEVQIYTINKNSSKESIISESSTVKLEFEADESIIDACWINSSFITDSNINKKRTKRNQSDEVQNNKNASCINLAISIKGGDILIASPNNDKTVNRISNENELFKLSQSMNDDSIYGITDNSMIEEISLSANKVIKGTQFAEDKNISFLKSVKYGKGFKSKNSQYILLGSQNLYLADISKSPRKALVTQFPKFSNDHTISNIIQSYTDENIIYVTRNDENDVYIYNLSDPKFSAKLHVSSSILNMQIISNGSEEAIAVFTASEVQFFNYDPEAKDARISDCQIYTNHQDVVSFSSLFLSGETLIGVWYDVNEPRFATIDWTFESKGSIKVPIEYSDKSNNITEVAENNIIIPESIEINNLASTDLFEKLALLLNSSQIEKQEIFDLCSSNDDESSIKETIKLFSSSPDMSPESINFFFEIISSEVAHDPSKSTALSIWLKWLLLAHGGYLAKQPQNYKTLKGLQSGLTDGLKLMPVLLGIQGRLQLLKAQTELRDTLYNNNYEESDDEDDVEDETEGNITVGTNSESFYFANGENDDFDSIEDKDEGYTNGENNDEIDAVDMIEEDQTDE